MPFIPYSIRDKHVHVIGKTGHGKSTLLAWWIYNDIREGEGGVCVIDPKGDLVDTIVHKIPTSRLKDCIWTDIQDPLPIDFLSCEQGQEQNVVADLKYILTAGMLDTANAPTLSANIENILYTLLDANKSITEDRCTLLDVADFFENPERRAAILRHVSDERLRRCWKELPPKPDIARMLTRVNPFVRNPTLSKVFGSSTARLNLKTVIEQKKILLVRVPVTHPFSSIYGSLLVSKIQQAAFAAQKRVPFFLYIDEFQNFRASQAFRTMLEMARSYKLCLTLANLDLEPLEATVRAALGIISTYILFRLSPTDAPFYKPLIESPNERTNLRERLQKVELDLRVTPYGTAWENLRYRRDELMKMVATLPPEPLTIQDALELHEYEAIYKLGNAVAVKAPTPKPASPPDAEQINNAQFIKWNSKMFWGAQSPFAESGQKRTGDNSACNSSQVPHSNDDEPQPGAAPSHHHHKGKDT